MVKCAIRARWVFLGASGMGVSETVAVEELSVAVSLHRFSTLSLIEKRKRAGKRWERPRG